MQNAIAIRNIYHPQYRFPEWLIDAALWDDYSWSDTTIFCHKGDDAAQVKALVTMREPCNIAMRRHYSEAALQKAFGYARGLYSEGSPNFAILCTATVKTRTLGFIQVKVINLIGCAQDHPNQPDSRHYNTLAKVRQFYKQMWRLALAAAIHSGCKKFRIYNVGGGAFTPPFVDDFEAEVFKPVFIPLIPLFQKAGIEVLGEGDARIPKILETDDDIANTVYVNAWDPWSLVGNGNAGDKSLDGAWGSCSNMAVLCWPMTNPHMLANIIEV